MNLSYNWLRELVGCDLSPKAMAEKLTWAGCAVEEIHPVGGDHCLVAEVTTNRPDWLCHWGAARELAALLHTEVRLPEWALAETGPDVNALTRVAVTDAARAFCPRYTARVIRGVTVGESPDWLKARLEALGQRPINNVVDITNYVMFETNEPLHAFDYDLLAGKRIEVRMARQGEPFAAITGEKGTLTADMLVIADAEKAVALAGVKGGAETEVHAGTVNLLLEAAYFQPQQVRRTSRATRMASESSYRVERGVDPGNVARASARAAQLILELAGGTLAAGVVDTGPDLAQPWELELRFARCEKILGTRIEPVPMANIFTGLGLEVLYKDAAILRVRVPTFRQDLTREIDLIEEVIRVSGYDKVPTAVRLPLCSAHEPDFVAAGRAAREILVGLGYFECITDTFVPEPWLADGPQEGRALRVQNPVNAERPLLRTSLIPSLLEVRRVNRLESDVRLFEINHIYQGTENEPTHLALLDDRGVEYVRGALDAVLAGLRVEGRVTVDVNDTAACFEPGSGMTLRVGSVAVARGGVISERTQQAHDLLNRPAALEVDLSALIALPRRTRLFQPLPRFPAVRRDIALVVPEAVRWNQIEAEVSSKPDRIERVEVQSVYRGKGLRPGEKSVAFAIVYRAADRSLTDAEANALRDGLVEHLTAAIPGARLR